MNTTFHEQTLTEYALPETLVSILGLKDEGIGSRIIASRYLAPVIEATLVPPFEDVELSDERQHVVEEILQSDMAKLVAVSRIIAVLTQSWHFSRAADGKTLRLAVEFSGEPEIVEVMRHFDLPVIENLPPLETLDAENLETIARFCLSFLLNLVPTPLLMRFAFMHPVEEFPTPLEMKDRARDVEYFTAMAGAAFYVLNAESPDETH